MAAAIKRDLGVDVKMEHGRYGEYRVLVDEDLVFDGGIKVVFGAFPSVAQVEALVRQKLSADQASAP